MDGGSSSSSSSTAAAPQLGSGRAIDRHNPIIRDARRLGKSLPLPPCTTSDHPPPLAPIPYKHLHNKDHRNRKPPPPPSSSSSSLFKSNDHTKKKSASSSSSKTSNSSNKQVIELFKSSDQTKKKSSSSNSISSSSSSSKTGDFINAPDSSRYLLAGDPAFLDVVSDFDPVSALVSVDPNKSQPVGSVMKQDDDSFSASNSKPSSSSSSSSSRPPDQVVVLRVSLHCKGCEGKVRKHISRMQGVTSFDIDFAAKKVTVVGDVTPLGVLASISKVKTAQLWTPPTTVAPPPTTLVPPPAMVAPPAPAPSSSRSELTNQSKGGVAIKA
ncbi:hypothetical protein U1Q18_013272 [Sarracenia purpurea var. burkii]